MSAGKLHRLEELACDAALFGVASAERRELESEADLLLDLELAAAEIAVASLDEREALAPLAPELKQRIEEAVLGLAERAPPTAEVKALRPKGAPSEGSPRAESRRPSAVPWLLAAAAVVLAAVSWLRRDDDRSAITGGAPTAATSVATAEPPKPDAAAPGTPAEARSALLGIPGTSVVEWKATKDDAGAQAAGDVAWHSGAQRGYMRFRGLAPNDPRETQYQLWIFDAERDERYPVDGGVFDVGPDGEVVVPIAAKLHVGKAKLFAVTVEKPGGVVVSKRERVVLTATPPPT